MVLFGRLALITLLYRCPTPSYSFAPRITVPPKGISVSAVTTFLSSTCLAFTVASTTSFSSTLCLSSSSQNKGNIPKNCNNSRRELQTSTKLFSEASSSSTKPIQSNTSGTPNKMNTIQTGYLNSKDAYDLDQELFSTGYTLEQLMELAGLAVAEAIYTVLPPSTSTDDNRKQKILLVCGPGNNGGDGLVAARHLIMFGYQDVTVVYPKRPYEKEPHYEKLVKQCLDVGVKMLDEMPRVVLHLDDDDDEKEEVLDGSDDNGDFYDAIVDAMFGFSFKGIPREPFASAIQSIMTSQEKENENEKKSKIISVDVPSGWNVDEGDVSNMGFEPDVLVSLTTPKLCSKEFQGRHFVGGRFLPPALAEKYGIQMPPYPGVSQVMEISNSNNAKDDDDDWAEQYANYCAEKESPTDNNKVIESKTIDDNDGDWREQYAAYCAEKEAALDQAEKEKSQQGEKCEKEDKEKDWALQYQEYCIVKEAKLDAQEKESS